MALLRNAKTNVIAMDFNPLQSENDNIKVP